MTGSYLRYMATLDERVAALEATIADLQAELAAVSKRHTDTMARAFRCPACGCRRIVHFNRVTELGITGVQPFTLWHERFDKLAHADGVEAFVCRDCRLIEWHVLGFDGVEINGRDVIEIDSSDPDASTTPYR